MSPTILPILSALLLSLISGSTESGQRMDPVALLRQTLRYWRKIYKMYQEEVALGYCWADYLLEISGELSTNLSAPSPATTKDRSSATAVGATKGQQNPFPRNVMTDAATPLRETRRGKYLRERGSHATSESIVPKLANASDMRRIASRSEIIQKRKKWMIHKAGVIPNRVKGNSETDENNRITPMTDFYDLLIYDKRRQALPPELFHDGGQASRDHQFLSRGTSSAAINVEDDDKVGSGSTGLDENTRSKILLHSLMSQDDASVQGAFGPRLSSLEVSRGRRRRLGGRRFPFQRYSRERNSRASEPSSDLWILEEDGGMKRHPGERRVSLNDDGSRSTLPHSQFRPANADTYERRRIVKLMDSEENLSCDSAINLKTLHRELCRDAFLLPHGEKTAGAERSLLESQKNGSDAVKGSTLSRPEAARGSDMRKRRQPREGKKSRAGRDVSEAAGTIHPFFSSKAERLRRKMPCENWEFSPMNSPLSIPGKERWQNNDPIPSLSRAQRFTDDDGGDSTSQSTRNSRLILLQTRQNRNQLSHAQSPSFVSNLRSMIIAVFRTLGIFVQVGR